MSKFNYMGSLTVGDFHIGQKVWTYFSDKWSDEANDNLGNGWIGKAVREGTITQLRKSSSSGGGEAVLDIDGKSVSIGSVEWLLAVKPEPVRHVTITLDINDKYVFPSDIVDLIDDAYEGDGVTNVKVVS